MLEHLPSLFSCVSLSISGPLRRDRERSSFERTVARKGIVESYDPQTPDPRFRKPFQGIKNQSDTLALLHICCSQEEIVRACLRPGPELLQLRRAVQRGSHPKPIGATHARRGQRLRPAPVPPHGLSKRIESGLDNGNFDPRPPSQSSFAFPGPACRSEAIRLANILR